MKWIFHYGRPTVDAQISVLPFFCPQNYISDRSNTLERDFPCFKTLKVKVRTFEPMDDRNISIEQKRGLCRFLEEALCNVGKHAQGVTRLCATCTQNEGWYTLCITDNGAANNSTIEGRGTHQAKNLARQLKGNFVRSHSPQGTMCALTWRVGK
jgi:two-component sensor histidine kinase